MIKNYLKVMLGNKLNVNFQWNGSDRKSSAALSVNEKLYTGLERYDTFVYGKTITGMQCLALVSAT